MIGEWFGVNQPPKRRGLNVARVANKPRNVKHFTSDGPVEGPSSLTEIICIYSYVCMYTYICICTYI